MIKILLSLILFYVCVAGYSQAGFITNIQVSQRTDGSGLVDVYFDLIGEANAYNILIEISFDGGNNFTPVPGNFLDGNIGSVFPGERNQITWNGHESFPNTYSTEAMLKIIAMEAIGAGIPCAGMPSFTDPRDGNVYNTVQIGDQCWLKENLKYLPEVYPSSEGSGEELMGWKSADIDKSESNIYYYVYDYEGTDLFEALATENYNNYGVLYNWHAALKACPTGWHLPSDAEWAQLIDFVVSRGYPNEWDNLDGAGNALKSCRQVNSPLGGECDTSDHPRWNSQSTHYGTDQFGFSALPGGLLYPPEDPQFGQIGTTGHWWSSTETWDIYSYAWEISLSYGSLRRLSYQLTKAAGLSVRCIRDN